MRLRLLVPRRRRGAGLSGLRPARARAPLALLPLLAAAAILLAAGCGGSSQTAGGAPGPARGAQGPALGLTEDNADLLWPAAAEAPPQAAPFTPARRELSALHPSYLRVLIDWAALQPSPSAPPALRAPVSGCARAVAPCGTYEGVAGELAAIAAQQRAARAAGRPGFGVVFDVLGAPAWAALQPHGCERAGTPPSARPLLAPALAGYGRLIGGLIALAREEGVEAPWWSPWNEPNDPRFLAPQREACDAGAPSLAPGVYAQLARAMAAQLGAAGQARRMLLGELGGYVSGSPHRTSISEFVAGLPSDVLCLGSVWSVHAYAARGRYAGGADPVAALEAALARRGGCAASAPIWVTEAGAGAPEPGAPGGHSPGEESAACLALAAQVSQWYSDPRIGAIFQYTFRDDPAFPVGLASADLQHLVPAYRMWLAFEDARAAGRPPPSPSEACG